MLGVLHEEEGARVHEMLTTSIIITATRSVLEEDKARGSLVVAGEVKVPVLSGDAKARPLYRQEIIDLGNNGVLAQAGAIWTSQLQVNRLTKAIAGESLENEFQHARPSILTLIEKKEKVHMKGDIVNGAVVLLLGSAEKVSATAWETAQKQTSKKDTVAGGARGTATAINTILTERTSQVLTKIPRLRMNQISSDRRQ